MWFLIYYRYHQDSREARFSIGVQGVAESDIDRIKQSIDRTLDTVIE